MIRRLSAVLAVLALALVLLPSLASAQVIRYIPPAGGVTIGSYSANCVPKATSSTGLSCGLATDDGTAFTLASGQLRLPNGTAGAPALAASASTSTGIFFSSTTTGISAGGTVIASASTGANGFGVNGPYGLSFANGDPSSVTADLFLKRDAANILAQRNGTAAQTRILNDTYTDASNYREARETFSGGDYYLSLNGAGTGISAGNMFIGTGSSMTGNLIFRTAAAPKWQIDAAGTYYPYMNDTYLLGGASYQIQSAYVARSIQGSKSKAITDATATTFATIAVSSGGYEGGAIIGVIRCADATNHATGTVRVTFACDDTGGTTSCAFGTPDFAMQGDGTAAISTPTFDATDGSSLANLRINADCTGVTPTTFTFESRADIPTVATYVPQ